MMTTNSNNLEIKLEYSSQQPETALAPQSLEQAKLTITFVIKNTSYSFYEEPILETVNSLCSSLIMLILFGKSTTFVLYDSDARLDMNVASEVTPVTDLDCLFVVGNQRYAFPLATSVLCNIFEREAVALVHSLRTDFTYEQISEAIRPNMIPLNELYFDEHFGKTPIPKIDF